MKINTPIMPVLPRALHRGTASNRWLVFDDKWQPIRYMKHVGWFVPVNDWTDAEFNLVMTREIALSIAANRKRVFDEDSMWSHHVFLFEYDAMPFMGLHPDKSYSQRIEKIAELTIASDLALNNKSRLLEGVESSQADFVNQVPPSNLAFEENDLDI